MPRPSLQLLRTSVMLQPRSVAAMRKLATKRGTTLSELIRIAMQEFITNEVHRLKSEAAHTPPSDPTA